jgi:hypothetical protein
MDINDNVQRLMKALIGEPWTYASDVEKITMIGHVSSAIRDVHAIAEPPKPLGTFHCHCGEACDLVYGCRRLQCQCGREYDINARPDESDPLQQQVSIKLTKGPERDNER